MQTVKIVDAFIFYNEIDLLNYRLNLLNDVVDHFVIVEATRTFKGEEKPLFFQIHKQQFAKFLPKIIHVVVDDLVFRPVVERHEIYSFKNGYWKNEQYQRNCIKRGIEQLNMNNHDYIIISDVDEIPNPEFLQKIKNQQENECFDFVSLIQSLYYYNLNCKIFLRDLNCPLMSTKSKIVSHDCFVTKFNSMAEDCRMKEMNYQDVKINCGWHLSSFGSPEFIKNKLHQYSHQELNTPELTNIEHIKKCIENNLPFFHELPDWKNYVIEYIPTSQNNDLPPMHDIYLKNFYNND